MTRALVFAATFACACSSASTTAAPSDSASDVTDASACDPDVNPSGGVPPSCPPTSDGVAAYCGSVTTYVYRLDCPHLAAYGLGFGIDTSKRCFYDPVTHALVGVSSTVNVSSSCWGVVDDSCAAGSVVCAPDAGAP